MHLASQRAQSTDWAFVPVIWTLMRASYDQGIGELVHSSKCAGGYPLCKRDKQRFFFLS